MAWLRAWVPLVWAVLLLASPRAALPAGGDSVDAVVRAAIAHGRLEYSRGGVAEAEQALAAAGAALTWADAMSHTALSVVVFAELAAVHMALRDENRAWLALERAMQGMTNTVSSDLPLLGALGYDAGVVQALIKLHATVGNARRRAFALAHFNSTAAPSWPHRDGCEFSRDAPRPRITIVTLCANYDPAVTPLTALSAANKHAYAAAHGYALQFETASRAPDRAPAWSKLRAVRAALGDPGVDWAVWVDCDSFFTNASRRLEDLLPPALACVLGASAALEDVDLVISEDGAMVNTGVFLLRNSAWSVALLDVLYGGAASPFAASPMWEQAALHALLASARAPDLFRGATAARGAESGALWRGLDGSVLAHTLVVPQRWINAYPRALAEMVYGDGGVLAHAPHAPGDFIVSMSGCRPVLGQRACNAMFGAYALGAAPAGSESGGAAAPPP